MLEVVGWVVGVVEDDVGSFMDECLGRVLGGEVIGQDDYATVRVGIPVEAVAEVVAGDGPPLSGQGVVRAAVIP